MDITLVVCTRNRSQRLDACLEHAFRQSCDFEWEVLVVDSASTDATPAVLAHWRHREAARMRTVRLEQPGLGRARHFACMHSSSPIVVFTDDDCYASEDYLQEVFSAFGRDPLLGALGGRILLHDPTDVPITINESLDHVLIEPHGLVRAGFIQGASMALRRMALEEVGGFDCRLGAGTPFPNEDVDIAARINAAGWRVSYEPSAYVYHHHGRKAGEAIDGLIRAYAFGRGAFYAKLIASGNFRYLRWWLSSARRQTIASTIQELRGAAHYAIVSLPFRSTTR